MASSHSYIRPPLPKPGSPDRQVRLAQDTRHVAFRHPAYPPSCPPLLLLGALDDGGVDYDLALDACHILAGSPADTGWLCAENGGGDDDTAFLRLARPLDGILRASTYYFFLSDAPGFRYPVCPSFDHWRFPHGRVPALWTELAVGGPLPSYVPPTSDAKGVVHVRDGTCRITQHAEGLESAHLVPAADGKWFSSNMMNQYCHLGFRPNPIDDHRNMMLLRRDLHYIFDSRRFALVPKRPRDKDSLAALLVVHVLLPEGKTELPDLYHNVQVQPLGGVAAEFLFARFAWTLFHDEHSPFFSGPPQLGYVGLVFDIASGQQTSRGWMPGQDEARIFPAASKSRSASPCKRKLGGNDREQEEDDHGCAGESWLAEMEMRQRGRKRRRAWEAMAPTCSAISPESQV